MVWYRLPDWRAIVEVLLLLLLGLACPWVQTTATLSSVPSWFLSGVFGLPLIAALLRGWWGVGSLSLGTLAAWAIQGAKLVDGIGIVAMVAEAAVVMSLLRCRILFAPTLHSPREILQFLLMALGAAATRALAAGVASVALVQSPLEPTLAAGSYELFAILLFSPAVFIWLRGPKLEVAIWARMGEVVILSGLVAGFATYWIGDPPDGILNQSLPTLAAILILGNWIAFRFHVRGMASFIVLTAGVGAVGAILRGNIPTLGPPGASIMQHVAWLVSLSIVLVFHLILAAVAKDYSEREHQQAVLLASVRKQSECLQDANVQLSERSQELSERTGELARQRDEFENLVRELSVQQSRLNLLESAVVHAKDAVIVLESQPQPGHGRSVLYVNKAFTEMMGYSESDVVGRSLYFLRGEKTDPHTLEQLRIALDTCRPFNGELLNYRRDGQGVWVGISLVPVRNAAGVCTHFVMIQRDVTDNKRAEEALQASEAKFRGMFETTSAGVYQLDESGLITACNPAFAALIDRPMNEIIGCTTREFVHPDDWSHQQEFDAAVRANQLDQYQFRKRYVRPNGEFTWVELSFAAVRDTTGKMQSAIGIAVDVTTRMTLEDQLRQSQKMDALGQLAGGVAHDFNNLLTAVLGNLSLIQMADDDPSRPLLRTVERAASRAAELTKKLLSYARRNQLMVTPVLPASMIFEVVDILRRTIDPRIEICTDIIDNDPVPVDVTLINQTLFNLCLNARDVMPNGGRLTITSRRVVVNDCTVTDKPECRSGTYLRLSVADTGPGIDDAVKKRIFEPFFTTKGVGRGTGLGLPMVQGIVKQHGGWVEFDTTLGQGTRFDLYLPLSLETNSNASPSRYGSPVMIDVTTPPPASGRMFTILLVDDEDMIRSLGRTILESQGYRVLEAVDGQDAVEVYTQKLHEIDLVIMDVTMPRLSGRDAYDQIMLLNPTCRVILSSGYSTEDISELGGTLGLLTKPYRPKDLLQAVSQALLEPAKPENPLAR